MIYIKKSEYVYGFFLLSPSFISNYVKNHKTVILNGWNIYVYIVYISVFHQQQTEMASSYYLEMFF